CPPPEYELHYAHRLPPAPQGDTYRPRSSPRPTASEPVLPGAANCPRCPAASGNALHSAASTLAAHGSWVDCQPDVAPTNLQGESLPCRVLPEPDSRH